MASPYDTRTYEEVHGSNSLLTEKLNKLQARTEEKQAKLGRVDNGELLSSINGAEFYDADSPYTPEEINNPKDTMRIGDVNNSTALYMNAPEAPSTLEHQGKVPTKEDIIKYRLSMIAKDNFAMGTTPASAESWSNFQEDGITEENWNLYQKFMKPALVKNGNSIGIVGDPNNTGKHGRQVVQGYNPNSPNPEESLQDRLLATGNAQMYSYGKPATIGGDIVNNKNTPTESIEDIYTKVKQDEYENAPWYEQAAERTRNAAAGLTYTLGEGIVNTLDLVPEIAEYAYKNIVGEGQDWSDTEGMYDKKDSEEFKEWTGYNEKVMSELGKEAIQSVKDAHQNGDYLGVLKTIGKAITTPELGAVSVGYVLGMLLPGGAAKSAVQMANGVTKTAKALRTADKTLSKAQSIALAEKEMGSGYKVAKVLAGQTGMVNEAEQFGRRAEETYKEAYGEEMPIEQKVWVRPLGLVYANMDGLMGKAIMLGKDPITKAINTAIANSPKTVKDSMVKKIAKTTGYVLAKVTGMFVTEGSTEGIQAGTEAVAGNYKADEKGVMDVLDEKKYDIAGEALLGGPGGVQMGAPKAAMSAINAIKPEPINTETATEEPTAQQKYADSYDDIQVMRNVSESVAKGDITEEMLDAVVANADNVIEETGSMEAPRALDLALAMSELHNKLEVAKHRKDADLIRETEQTRSMYMENIKEYLEQPHKTEDMLEYAELVNAKSGLSESERATIFGKIAANLSTRTLGTKGSEGSVRTLEPMSDEDIAKLGDAMNVSPEVFAEAIDAYTPDEMYAGIPDAADAAPVDLDGMFTSGEEEVITEPGTQKKSFTADEINAAEELLKKIDQGDILTEADEELRKQAEASGALNAARNRMNAGNKKGRFNKFKSTKQTKTESNTDNADPETEAETEQEVKEPKSKTYQTDTHTVGISDRSIEKVAKALNIDPDQLRKAYGSAVRDIRIKNMKKVGKESNKVQYEVYHGTNGIMPTFSKLKKAIATKDKDEVEKASKSLIDRSVNTQTAIERYQIEYDGMYEEIKSDVETMLKNGESIPDILAVANGADNRKPAGAKHTIKSGDVFKDVLVDLVEEGKITPEQVAEYKIDTKYKSPTLEIITAQKETVAHLEEILESLNITPPTVEGEYITAAEEKAKAEAELVKLEKELETAKAEKIGLKIKTIKKMIDNRKEIIEKVDNGERRPKRFIPQVTGAEFDLEKYLEEEGGLGIDEIHVASQELRKKATKKAEGVAAKKAEAAAKKANEGKENFDGDTAKEITEVTKVTGAHEIKQVLEEIEDTKKAKVEVSKKQVKVKKLSDGLLARKETELANELGKAEKGYYELEEKIGNMYKVINAKKNDVDNYKRVQDLVGKIKAKEMDYREGFKELNSLVKSMMNTPDELKSRKKGVLAKIQAFITQTTKIAGLAKRLLRFVSAKVTGDTTVLDKMAEEFAVLEKETNEQIKGTYKQISAKKLEQDQLVTKGMSAKEATDKMNKIGELTHIIRKVKKKRNKSQSANSKAAKVLNEKLKELYAKLKNTTYMQKAKDNSAVKLKSGENINEKEMKSLYDGIQGNEGADLMLEAQPLDIWTQIELNPSVVGAVDLEGMQILAGEFGETYKVLHNKLASNLVRKTGGLDTSKSGVDLKLFKDPAYGVIVMEDGSINPAYLNSATIVSADFIANSLRKMEYKSRDDIAKMLEYDNEFDVTGKQVKLFTNSGDFKKLVTYGLGNAIARNMGITKKPTMSIEHWDKFVQGLGQSALVAMEGKYIKSLDKSVISADDYKNAMQGSKSTFEESVAEIHMVQPLKVSDTDINLMKGLTKELRDGLDIDGVTKNYRTQKNRNLESKTWTVKGSPTDVPPKHQETLRKAESQEYGLNTAGLEVIDEMAGTPEELMELMGYRSEAQLQEDILSGQYTADHIDSVISRNREVEVAVEEMMDLRAKVANGEMENSMYFDYFFSKNGRFFIDSAGINPQTEKKLHRWLVVNKEAENTFDWDKDEDRMYFKIALVQAFDGAKLKDKEGNPVKDENGNTIKVGDGIDKMQLHKVEEMADRIIEMDEKELIQYAKEADHIGHAASAIAGLRAMKAAKGKPFKATMLIEYDAVTSGFILKLLQMPILGKKLVKWIEKGGIFEQNADKLKDGEGTADVIGKVEGIVDAYKSQGHLVYEMAQDANSGTDTTINEKTKEVVFSAGDVVLKKGEPAKPRDPKGIIALLEKAKLIDKIFELEEDGTVKMEKVDGAWQPVMTSFGRNLFKPGFMTFNYGSSLTSIKKKVGEVLAEGIMNKLMKGEATVELKIAIAGSEAAFNKAMLQYRAMPSEAMWKDMIEGKSDAAINQLKVKIAGTSVKFDEMMSGTPEEITFQKATNGNTETTLQGTLQYLLSESYGSAVTAAMQKEFGELIEANETIIASTKVMFRLWKKAYDKKVDKLTEKGTLLTFEEDQKIFKDLAKKFPLIKAPLSESDMDGAAVNSSSLISSKNNPLGQTQTSVKAANDKVKTRKVQLMTRELKEAHAAGAVLPIHWIDGTVIGEILGEYDGVLGVHDAIVLGKDFTEIVKGMNQATGEIGKNYDLVGAIMDSLMNSLEGEDAALSTMFDEETTYADVVEKMMELYEKNTEAREKFYNEPRKIGNISGHKGTIYEMSARVQDKEGIIDPKYEAKIMKEIDRLIEECI